MPHVLTALLKTIWLGLQGFVYYYPLFMSYLWMMGAALFYWRFERHDPPFNQPVPLSDPPSVSILIPCFNEGAHAEETLRHALAMDYPDFEVILVDDGSCPAGQIKEVSGSRMLAAGVVPAKKCIPRMGTKKR